MELSITLPMESSQRNPAKIAALACGFIAVGLLVASLISAVPARAGGKVNAGVATSDR